MMGARTHLVDDLKDTRAGSLHQLLVRRPQALGKQTQEPLVHHLRDVYPANVPLRGKNEAAETRERRGGGEGDNSAKYSARMPQ